ncbi:hypothetical protein CGCTS75_v002920 [Colletotrichum tropicale]|nr:hypothetical protein CGCTS75_v002920 [Colletotrichum tropicale]
MARDLPWPQNKQTAHSFGLAPRQRGTTDCGPTSRTEDKDGQPPPECQERRGESLRPGMAKHHEEGCRTRRGRRAYGRLKLPYAQRQAEASVLRIHTLRIRRIRKSGVLVG